MPQPKGTKKVSVFFDPLDQKDFKTLCAQAGISMCRRLEALAKLDSAYFKEYGKLLSIENVEQMYFGDKIPVSSLHPTDIERLNLTR